jgi:cytochrome c oxidase subunit 3
MRPDYHKDLDPVVRVKMKKNLVYVGIFSVVMFFAALTSAYIVVKGDSFWLKYPLPTYFWISTAIILVSSILLEVAIRKAKNKSKNGLRIFILATLLSGLAFVYFQFKGYGSLVDNGVHFSFNHIMVVDGRYGDKYLIKYKGELLDVDGVKYLYKGKKMPDADYNRMSEYMKQYLSVSPTKLIKATNNSDFELIYNQEPIQILNGKLCFKDSTELKFTDQKRLADLAQNIVDKRVDFFIRGEFDKDFQVFQKGIKLEYKNREFIKNGKPLSRNDKSVSMSTADMASQFLYLITAAHLLHIIGTLFYLIKMTKNSFSGKYDSGDILSLRLGAIFWHFLGILWGYLLLFLLFIH